MVESIAVVATVSQAPEASIRFCLYHLDIGVDHIFLFFDKPRENNISILHDNDRITCISCTKEYWLERGVERSNILIERNIHNFRRAVELCKERDINIIAPIDGDELLYPDQNFKAVLTEAFDGMDAVLLHPYEAVHDKKSITAAPFESKYFKVLPNRINRCLVPLFYKRIFQFSDDGFFGHLVGKTLFRTNAEIVAYENTHRPRFGETAKVGKTNLLKLLHFDCALEDDWVHKWKLRFDGGAIPTMRPKRELQYNEIKRAVESGEQSIRQLYRKYYLYGSIQIGLGRCLGLFQKFDKKVRES